MVYEKQSVTEREKRENYSTEFYCISINEYKISKPLHYIYTVAEKGKLVSD